MLRMKNSIIPWIFFTWLIWWPIIINSQPGNTFVLFGIDWKADNLDNTMFWIGIILSILLGVTSEAEKRDDRRWQYEKQTRDI